MSHYDQCLAELRIRFGADAFLLTPKQIAPIINKSVGVQSNMRYLNTFPIPVKKIGRSVFISIYHLAEWLVTQEGKTKELKVFPKHAIKSKKKIRGNYDHLLT